tara:strand:+ start:1704 stop:3584 length:1881 start_codon:yes stop_codon:yes gene_type:complete
MLGNLGLYSVLIVLLISLLLTYLLAKEFQNNEKNLDKKIFILSLIQIIFSLGSFAILILSYVLSDFSVINVYENSHSSKPIIYKITGAWGNHEGSLLLWINILVLFSYLFLIKTKNIKKNFKALTLFFQNILICVFLIFLITNSNPFLKIYPTPLDGMGLNPILQDPALAIHPPLLYLGFVGSSIYFSAGLASLISKTEGNLFAKTIKNWVLISWFFQTLGILTGSVWAYYELGWGGFWFWDPVENSSLMPWFLMTALLHSVLVLQRKSGLYSWVIVLSILTFTMSVVGTFLVRSGVLNSVHTFANDPSRGLFILSFLSLMVFSSIFIFFKYAPIEKKNFNILTKEFFILINNWFMIFFLIVVLLGTLYPIFLDTISSKQISIGPPYYNFVLAPFLLPLLIFMSQGPKSGWKDAKYKNMKYVISVIILSLIIYFFIYRYVSKESFLINLILITSIYLITQSMIDLFDSFIKKKFNFSRILSHLGFGLLIFFISINHIFSVESNFNIKLGDTKTYKNYVIKFEDLKVFNKKNYKSVEGSFIIVNSNKLSKETLKPEIRMYNQPQILTYEASIKSKIFSDTYITMSNLSDSEFYNVKFQTKPYMNFIWLSVLLISFGGIINFLRVQKK